MSIIFKILIALPVIKAAVLNTCPRNDCHPKVHSDSIPEVGLNTTELIAFNGYLVESHPNIITPDGYILEMQRIPSGKSNARQLGKPPVLIMAGLLSSSADFVNMGWNISLGFILADAGFDVWLGNSRGSTWSRKHVSLNPDLHEKYWDYSWHEIGIYDVPTKIDYILSATGQESLYYIGYSQGGVALFVLTSQRPEYNKKIRFAGLLGPGVFVSHISSLPFIIGRTLQDEIQIAHKIIGLYEILPSCRILQQALNLFCNHQSPLVGRCSQILIQSMAGDGPVQFNTTRLMVYLSNFPAGSSMKQFIHFFQVIKANRFQQFDYKAWKNLEVYGQVVPPDYNFQSATVPVGIYYGGRDILVPAIDVEKLAGHVPNLVAKHLVPQFNHVDLLIAMDVRKLLYDPLISRMKMF